MKSIGWRIKLLREAKGWTQAELARLLRQVQLDPHAGEVHLVWWPEPQETTLQTRNTAFLQAGGGVRTTGGVGGGTQAVVRTTLLLPVRIFRAKSPFPAE